MRMLWIFQGNFKMWFRSWTKSLERMWSLAKHQKETEGSPPVSVCWHWSGAFFANIRNAGNVGFECFWCGNSMWCQAARCDDSRLTKSTICWCLMVGSWAMKKSGWLNCLRDYAAYNSSDMISHCGNLHQYSWVSQLEFPPVKFWILNNQVVQPKRRDAAMRNKYDIFTKPQADNVKLLESQWLELQQIVSWIESWLQMNCYILLAGCTQDMEVGSGFNSC